MTALQGCAVVTTTVAVGSAAVSVASTAVNVGTTAAGMAWDVGKAGVNATTTVAGWAVDSAQAPSAGTPLALPARSATPKGNGGDIKIQPLDSE
ncbi:hypothetical protein IGB42_01688 [Andreprevotia sp. IGB-42]|nr:hypothetical protein IGB42_01688 [Andreprevotia sp. IGB-42]